jgi:hypothetical protein
MIAADALEALMDAPFVVVGGVECSGRDLVAAGAVSGRWAQLERELAAGLAAVDATAPDDGEVDAALRDFRYARRLISASDFRGWLGVRGLTVAAVRGALARNLARRDGAPAAAEVDREQILAALPAEAVCSGALRDCGEWLADRLLAGDGEVDEARLSAALAAEAGLVAVAALGEPDEERRERLARVLAACAAYERRIAEALTEEAIAACVHQHLLDWVAVEIEGLRSPNASVAAEVALMLRADGVPLVDVARAAGLEVERRAALLGEVEEELAPLLAAAAVGEVVGPLPAHEVWQVARRVAPEPGDPAVRERAIAALTALDAERRRTGRVRWHERA